MKDTSKLKAKIEDRVAEAVAGRNVNADPSAIAPITEAVMEEVLPRIEHLTNAEPFYRSRTFWGLVVLVVSRELALRGYAIPPEFHGPILDLVVSYGPYAAVGLITWGRWIARKPLFSGWFGKGAPEG